MSEDKPEPSAGDDRARVRESIDRLDAELLRLLGRRRELSIAVARIKDSEGIRLRDQRREEEVLADMVRQGRELGLDAHLIATVFNAIFEDSIRIQEGFLQSAANADQEAAAQVRIAIEGDVGSYSYLAARRHFAAYGERMAHITCADFAEVIGLVERGSADYAVLPIENTTSGAINDVYDLLLHTSLSIVGEEEVAVNHCLLAARPVPLAELKRIYGHPQGIAQCSHFLAGMRHCEIVYRETTGAARAVKDDSAPAAAIAGRGAAELFGLEILKEDIANQSQNYTRFLIAARKPRKVALQVPCKTSLVMTTGHQPGSLLEALALFRDHRINLVKLESRPIAGNPWEEMFYLDLDGNIAAPNVAAVLRELARVARFVKVLGSYPARHLPATPVPAEALALAGTSTAQPAPSGPAAPRTADAPAAGRASKAADRTVSLRGVEIGGGSFVVIASVGRALSREQIESCARRAREHGARLLRADCFGAGTGDADDKALQWLRASAEAFGLPAIVEVSAESQVAAAIRHADALFVGAHRMQDQSLLRAVGRVHRPVVLERGFGATPDEWLDAADYVTAQGNQQLILCESGTRRLGSRGRNTLDSAMVSALLERTDLPLIVDPCRTAVDAPALAPLAREVRDAGVHGVSLEVRAHALDPADDGPQVLDFAQFADLMAKLYQR